MYSFPSFEPGYFSMSSSNCCFLTAYRKHVKWSIIPVSLRQQFVVICTVKGCSIINETKVDIFLEFSFFSYGPMVVCNLIFCSSAFSKSSLYIWKCSFHVLLQPSLKDFEHYLASMWNKCYCAIVWTFFDIALFWDQNENRPFPVLGPLLSFPNLQTYWVQHFNNITF